jgi:hypothetical protein
VVQHNCKNERGNPISRGTYVPKDAGVGRFAATIMHYRGLRSAHFGERLVGIGGRKLKVFLFVATFERHESRFDRLESAFLTFGGAPEEVLPTTPARL